jgi:hypothetical protein
MCAARLGNAAAYAGTVSAYSELRVAGSQA